MPQYKTVAGPIGLTISQDGSYSDAVRQYANIINREAVNGWKLDCIQEIPVTKEVGCLGILTNQANTTVRFNMLIFVKEDPIEDNTRQASTTYSAPSRPVVAPVSTEKNPNKANDPVNAEIKDGEKICPQCGMKQKADRHICWSCGQRFDN